MKSLLVGGGEVTLDVLGSENENVEVVFGLIDDIPVGQKVVDLGNGLEGSQETVGAGHRIRIGVEGDNPAISEGDLVISIELLSFDLLEVGGVLLGNHSMDEAEGVVETHVIGVTNNLTLLSSSSLPDNSLMIESLGHWVDKSRQSQSIGPLHSSSDVSNQIP